ncbi:MAG TPA: GNAT family N-acetyltransferase [Bryobacteraceae bacterium]|nr:GNAT family N-acetyltransferase [Bryobacteraceae bacterium]
MIIRAAEVSEAESLVQLINAAFRIEEFFVDGDRIRLDQLRPMFAAGEFLVADGEGAPAGCVYVEQRGDRAYFGLLSIDPARQRTGLGSRLVDAAEHWARGRGCRFMDLRIVNLREELPGFYRRLGYVEGATEAFPAGTPTKLPCHFVTMWKLLD